MGWARLQPAPHRCGLPYESFGPAGRPGDLYRCDDCQRLWKHDRGDMFYSARWRPAGWLTRLRYRNKGRADK